MTSITWPRQTRSKSAAGATVGFRSPSPAWWLALGLAVAVVIASLVARAWLNRIGDTRYQEFLRMEWVLVRGGKGLHLDILSLPLAPAAFVLAALPAGPAAAEIWLPTALAVAVVLVITVMLLGGSPLFTRLTAVALVLACPFFYLLQRQLDLQLYLLLLGLHLWALRAFRQRPSAARASVAICVNIVFSLTTYAAALVLAASAVYLIVLTHRQREVEPDAWRALLWLYVPFSFVGYAFWAVFWAVAGSRQGTSVFLPAQASGPAPLQQFLHNAGGTFVLPLLLALGLTVAMVLLLRSRSGPAGQNQAIIWAVITCMAVVLGLLSVESALQRLPILPAALTFSLVLLVPAAIGGAFGHISSEPRRLRWAGRLVPFVLGAVVLAGAPLQYAWHPGALPADFVPLATRTSTEREAAAAFVKADPGGRILLDPRYAATFVLAAHIDPRRLLTPFDRGFVRLVKTPPADVRTLVVTESLGDDVAGNHTVARIADLLPDLSLIASAKAGAQPGAPLTRAFLRESTAQPDGDAPRVAGDAVIAAREDTILATVKHELEIHGGLPYRPDGWAYAIDLGNLMVYSAHRGDLALFRQMADQVEQRYLILQSNDSNALYSVAWRFRPDRTNEASGTTETLRMVEAYWTAGERWNNDHYRRLAWLMAKAYAHHQTSDQYGENWFIRNYYNYGTQGFATNSFLVDYAPDALRYVADAMHDTDLRAVADQSAKFLLAGQTQIGLFQEMYQPELSTLYKNLLYFSPNGIMQLIDSEEAALGLSKLYAPERARLTYDFAKAQYLRSGNGHVSNQYFDDGSPLPKGEGSEGGPAVYAYIARLGARLGDPAFARRLIVEQLDPSAMYGAGTPAEDGNWYFAWSSALLAAREYQEALTDGPPVPPAAPAAPAQPAAGAIAPAAGPAPPAGATDAQPTAPVSAGPDGADTQAAALASLLADAVARAGQAFTRPSYIAQPGDSLTGLAARFGLTVDTLAAANGMPANTRLRIGQKLLIPLAAPPAGGAAPAPR